MVDLLLKQPNLRSLEIVRRARAAGYEGGKSAFYSLIASVRPRRSRPLSEHDKVPGEIGRHGFGQVDLRFRDGGERSVTFFVSRLEYARFTAASIVPDQGLETCVRTLVSHYRALGGVPLLAAFDRARPIGVGSDKDGRVQEWDPAFAYAALQIGLGVEVRARRGADRGPGTNLGNWLKLAFFKDASFVDEAAPRASWRSGCATRTTRRSRTRAARRRRSCWPRSGSAFVRSRSSRTSWRCASRSWSGRAER